MKPLPVILTVLAVYAAWRIHSHLVARAMRDGVELGAAHAGHLTIDANGVRVHNPSPMTCECIACRRMLREVDEVHDELVITGVL